MGTSDARRGSEATQGSVTSEAQPPSGGGEGLGRPLALYSLARVGLVVLVSAILVGLGVPLVVAVLVALIVGLPLSMLLFRGLRTQVTEGLAVRGARRAAERAALRAKLRGETPPAQEPAPSEQVADGKPDAEGE